MELAPIDMGSKNVNCLLLLGDAVAAHALAGIA